MRKTLAIFRLGGFCGVFNFGFMCGILPYVGVYITYVRLPVGVVGGFFGIY